MLCLQVYFTFNHHILYLGLNLKVDSLHSNIIFLAERMNMCVVILLCGLLIFFLSTCSRKVKKQNIYSGNFRGKIQPGPYHLWTMVELRSLSASRWYITCMPWRTKCRPFITSNFPFLACKAMVTSEPIFETIRSHIPLLGQVAMCPNSA